ncbi:MAG TPA: 2OG-Fe(II) oxygenase [Gammaproteobacteria bacterium]|nr:2OG-Fe(II) oxygenase [Gammaproteobacteria bacterium]
MLYQEVTLEQFERLNAGLYARFMDLSGADRTRQTHFFAGRFENIYLDEAEIPEITVVLKQLRHHAGKLLGRPADSLKAGFWFNAMQAGHVTSLHHHDEDDELLSAAYYVRVPEHSGKLVLHAGDRRVTVEPQEGRLVMFAPAVLHEVTKHCGSGLRLSVGMNVGPADS